MIKKQDMGNVIKEEEYFKKRLTFPTNNQETEWNVTYKKERELATDWKGKGNIYKRTEMEIKKS